MKLASNNVNDLWLEAIEDIMDTGNYLESRNGVSQEVIGMSLVLSDITRNLLTIPGRKLSKVYAAAELLWYLSGSPKGDMIKFYAPSYERFLDNGYAHGAYGNRWFRALRPSMRNQFQSLLFHLRDADNTRQGVISCWFPDDIIFAADKSKKDIPCTLSLQFIPRDRKLHLITTMRSNDFWLGFPYDIWCFTSLQRLIADELELSYGTYHHNVGSAHIYERDFLKVRGCIDALTEFLSPSLKFTKTTGLMQDIAIYPEVERQLRETDRKWSHEDFMRGTLLDHCLALCWSKIGYVPQAMIDNVPEELRP